MSETRLLVSALVASHRGSYDHVITLLSPNHSYWFQVERWWLLAEAYARLGRSDSTAAYLERLTASRGIMDEDNLVLLGMPYSFAHFRLGNLYTQLEQFDRAEEHYLTFLETFTQPDPEYVGMREEARAALETLARGR